MFFFLRKQEGFWPVLVIYYIKRQQKFHYSSLWNEKGNEKKSKKLHIGVYPLRDKFRHISPCSDDNQGKFLPKETSATLYRGSNVSEDQVISGLPDTPGHNYDDIHKERYVKLSPEAVK